MCRTRLPLLFCLALGAALGGAAAPARAGQPFFYYPAYGSPRGKIVYRDGLLVNRQKVRWGGGITTNGAAVFHDLFAAAVPIVNDVLGGGKELDLGMSPEQLDQVRRDEADKQQRANAMLAQTVALRRSLGIPDEAVGGGPGPAPIGPPPTGPVAPVTPGGPVNDAFSDWGSSLSNAPTPMLPTAPPPAQPVPQPAPQPVPQPVPQPAPAQPLPIPPAISPPAAAAPGTGVKLDKFQDWET
jgi:hypothetical protein